MCKENKGDATASRADLSANDGSPENMTEEPPPSCMQRIIHVYMDNEFLAQIIMAILLARAYPPIGAKYLYPDITATWIAVCFIFILAGLGLKTAEFSNALKQFKFNVAVQLFSFGVCSVFVFGLSRGLEAGSIISKDLADGMTICASLPMTINMCLVLTKSSGGDEAAAIFNAAFGNLMGVFLSPVLILGYLGVSGDIDLAQVFFKLAARVVLPVAVGQILQKTCPPVVAFNKQYKKHFKKAQQLCLVFIVYTVFCKTFEEESDSSIGDIFLMILFQFVSLMSLMFVAWGFLAAAFPDQPKLRVFGLFGCTHKTVAMGVPLINAIYEDNPSVGLYTLPLLIWHPMQLVIGTFISPKLTAFVESEKQRLGITDDDDEEEEASPETPVADTEAAEQQEAPKQ